MVQSPGIGIAFFAGFLSFISPCVLPLIPAYIGYLTGRATTQFSSELAVAGSPGTASIARTTVQKNRLGVMLHGVFFVIGFTIFFVGFGLITNAGFQAIQASYDIKSFLYTFGGLLVMFFGLHVMGVTGWLLKRFIADLHGEEIENLNETAAVRFSIPDFFTLCCAITLLVAFLFVPWINTTGASLTGRDLLSTPLPDAVADLSALVTLMPVLIGCSLFAALWGLFVAQRTSNTARRGAALAGLVVLLAYGLFFVLSISHLVAATSLINIGLLIPLLASLGLVIQVMIPRPGGLRLAQVSRWGKTLARILERIQGVLYSDARRQVNPRNPYGYVGSSLMGIVFAAGWSPCIGPIYGAVLTMAATRTTSNEASVLLLAYSLGLGMPFLMTAAALDRTRGLLKRLQRQMRLIEVVSGVFLIAMGYLLYTNQMALIAQYATNLGVNLGNIEVQLETCIADGWMRGKIPLSEVGACLAPSLTPAASESSSLTRPVTPGLLMVLPDGRGLYVR